MATLLTRELRNYKVSSGALGPHLADQWVLPLALAVHLRQQSASYTCTELTPHALSNFEVIQAFLPVRINTQADEQQSQHRFRVSVSPA